MKSTQQKLRQLALPTLVLGVSLTGCATESPLDGEVDSKEQQLYYLTSNQWNTKVIDVCFETSGNATEKAWVEEILKGQRSWEEAGNVNFAGFGSCNSSSTGIRVTLGSAAFANYLGQIGNVAHVTIPVQSGVEGVYPRCSQQSPALNREQCIKTEVLHEFGHVLSITHEQNRPDKPSACTATPQPGPGGGNATYGNFDEESIMAYGGGSCVYSADLSALDRRGVGRMYGEREGDTHALGDFNGDGRDDIMCHDAVDGRKWVDYASSSGQFAGTNWSTSADWCGHDTGKLLKGDFNGDGREDLMCHDIANGYKWIDLANSSGQFGGTDWSRDANWCSHDGGQLVVGDFNGDGRDDIMCHDVNDGRKWVDYASSSGQFAGTNWSTTANWCSHDTARLHVGDFNGDGRDDIMCHDVNDGRKWVDYASSSGQFAGTDWSTSANWCGHAGAQLFVGDYNGDGREDLLCHDTATGSKWVDYASSSGQFAGTNWSTSANWCSHKEGRLYVGDVNGDGNTDILCHDVVNGSKWVDYASSSGQFAGTNWSTGASWCSHDSGVLR